PTRRSSDLPECDWFATIIDEGDYDYARSATRRRKGFGDAVVGDGAVFAGGSPVQFERAERIVFEFLGMLLPVRIGHPDGIGRLEIFVLDGLKELIEYALLSPV